VLKTVHDALLGLHVVFGFLGLTAFWVPVFAPKGGRTHVRAGKAFLAATWVVAVSAIVLSVMTVASPAGTHPDEIPADPAAAARAAEELRRIFLFLGYLGVITLATVFHGVRAIQRKREPERVRTPFHTALAVAAIASGAGVALLGLLGREAVFLALSPIGVVIGAGMLRYARRPPQSRMAHWYEHLGGMLGGGIAFHTAFAVFGIQRFIEYSMEGIVGLLPWVAPAIVGSAAIGVWTRRYRRRFGEG